MIKNVIEEKLEVLKGEPWVAIGRAGDMLWIGFGDDIEYTNPVGRVRTVSAYALHLQCPWRIVEEKSIIIASYDIYQPASQMLGKKDFDWDVHGNNLFDEKADEIHRRLKTEIITVNSVLADQYGGIKLDFDNGLVLEVFINSCEQKENWRMLDNKLGPHFVVFERH